MRSLGADHVTDYTREDFTKNGRCYDLILDLAAHRPAVAYKGLADARGTLPVRWRIGVHASCRSCCFGPLIGRTEGKRIRLLAVRRVAQHLAPLAELCQAGKIATGRSSTAATG